MITDKKSLPNSRLKLTMVANAAQFRHAFAHELEHVRGDVSIPGFRPGKAPDQKVIERVGRQRIEAGAIDHAISDVYFEDLREAKIVPVANPSINVEKYEAIDETTADDKEVLTFTAEVDVLPEVKIDGYKKLRLKKAADKPVIADEEVEKVIEYLRKQKATLNEVPKDTELKNEMWADLGYEGEVDGIKRDDMKNEHHPLVIGEGQLIPGFEEQILGMKAGEERIITVTFPKDYHAKELSGKKAQFTVTVHEIKEVVLPEKDEKFAADFGHPSFEKLEAAIRENLHTEKEQETRQKTEEEAIDLLLGVTKVELPQSLVEQEMDRMFEESKERLGKMNFNWETYLSQVGKTSEEIKEEMRPQAERRVNVGLALGKLMEEEGLNDQKDAGRVAIDRLLEIVSAEGK